MSAERPPTTMLFAYYDQDLLALMALFGVLLLVRGHPRLDVNAIRSALVWDLTEAGRLQGGDQAFGKLSDSSCRLAKQAGNHPT